MEYVGRAEVAIIAMSSYRLHIKFKESVINVSVVFMGGTSFSLSLCLSLSPSVPLFLPLSLSLFLSLSLLEYTTGNQT